MAQFGKGLWLSVVSSMVSVLLAVLFGGHTYAVVMSGVYAVFSVGISLLALQDHYGPQTPLVILYAVVVAFLSAFALLGAHTLFWTLSLVTIFVLIILQIAAFLSYEEVL